MFDIRNHGGVFGGGINKSKSIPVNKTNLTNANAIVVQTGIPYNAGIILYYDDNYVYSYVNNLVCKHDRYTGAQILAKTCPTNYTITEGKYDPTNSTFYCIIAYSNNYYLWRYNITNDESVMQVYIRFANGSGGFAITPNNVYFFIQNQAIYKLPKNFAGTNTEYITSINATIGIPGNAYYNPNMNKLCFSHGTAYSEMNADTMEITKTIASNFGVNYDKSFLMDDSFKYTYHVFSNGFYKRDIQGTTVSTVYQTTIADVGGLQNYHILSFDENKDILLRNNMYLQKITESNGSVSTLAIFSNYYFYKGFYDIKNSFFDYIQLSGNAYVSRVYEKLRFK